MTLINEAAMTPLLFTKLLRDIQTSWERMVMMVLAISASLIVFSGMSYARTLVLSNTTSGYMSTNPASARIRLEPGIISSSWLRLTIRCELPRSKLNKALVGLLLQTVFCSSARRWHH